MSKYIFYKTTDLQRPRWITKEQYNSDEYGTEYIYEPQDYPYTFYWFTGSSDFASEDYNKLKALKNTINYYFGSNEELNYSNFYNVTSSLICFSSNYIGSGIQKGSVTLAYNISGTILDQASDIKENGILSSSINGIVGIVLYKEGFIILNNSTQLTSAQDVFLGSLDYPRWTNFYGNNSTNLSCSCIIEFLGNNSVPTNTTIVVVDKNTLNHSNNLTYIESGSYTVATGSSFFKENDKLAIKNIVKSPFNSGSAVFEKETYITRIGLFDKDKKVIGYASLANPIRKTENREFIFKLKIDI